MAATTLDDETAKKVIRQVEFYFSDSNLPRDKFLKNAISESEDGMVSLALISSFSRMRNHLVLGDMDQEDIEEDIIKAVAETLRSSSFIKVSEDGKKVGRSTELSKPEEVIEQVDIRTIAASPLEHDVKLEEVESFFGQFAKVNSVRMPRHVADKRLFSGTALIEFSTEEDATKMLGQSLTFAGVELELKPKKDFDKERANQLEQVESFRSQTSSNRRNNSSIEDNYPKGLIVAFKLRSIIAEGSADIGGQKPANGDIHVSETEKEPDSKENVAEDSELMVETQTKDAIDEESITKSAEKVDFQEVKNVNDGEKIGTKTSFTTKEGIDTMETPSESSRQNDELSVEEKKSTVALYTDNKDVVLREDLKVIFRKFGTVKFIDFSKGEDSGYVRFDDPGAAQKARAAAVLSEQGGLVVKNFIATLDPVSGEAEREYWSLLRCNQDKHRENMSNRGRGGRHNNRGGRHHGGKHSRPRENDSTNRPHKVQKVSST